MQRAEPCSREFLFFSPRPIHNAYSYSVSFLYAKIHCCADRCQTCWKLVATMCPEETRLRSVGTAGKKKRPVKLKTASNHRIHEHTPKPHTTRWATTTNKANSLLGGNGIKHAARKNYRLMDCSGSFRGCRRTDQGLSLHPSYPAPMAGS